MKRANELAVGTVAIGYWMLDPSDMFMPGEFPNRARHEGIRLDGREVTVWLERPEPEGESNSGELHRALEREFGPLVKFIALNGLLGECSHGVHVVLVLRDRRADDVRLLDRWIYQNPKEAA
ncbi:MAG: hypothetical protein AB1705_15375 [Verrucomicrobiota bacterium]